MDELDIVLGKLGYPDCKDTITYEEILNKLSVSEIDELERYINDRKYVASTGSDIDAVFCRNNKNFIEAVFKAYDNRNRKFHNIQQLIEKEDFESSDELKQAIIECLSNYSIPKEERIAIVEKLIRNEKMTPQINWDIFDDYSKLLGVDKTIEFITESKIVTPDILIRFLMKHGWDLKSEQIIKIVNCNNADSRVMKSVVNRYYRHNLNKDKVDFNIVGSVLEKAKINRDKDYVSLELFIEIIHGEEWYGGELQEIPKKLEHDFLSSDMVNAKTMEDVYKLYKKIDTDRKEASDLNSCFLLDMDKYYMDDYKSTDFYDFDRRIAALSSLVMDDTGDREKAIEFIKNCLGEDYVSLYIRCKDERLESLSNNDKHSKG